MKASSVSGIKNISRGKLNVCAAAADSYAQSSLDPIEKYVTGYGGSIMKPVSYIHDHYTIFVMITAQDCLKGGWCEECTRSRDLGIHYPLVWIECGLQPSEQSHFQLFSIPLVRINDSCGDWYHVLRINVPIWSQESIF